MDDKIEREMTQRNWKGVGLGASVKLGGIGGMMGAVGKAGLGVRTVSAGTLSDRIGNVGDVNPRDSQTSGSGGGGGIGLMETLPRNSLAPGRLSAIFSPVLERSARASAESRAAAAAAARGALPPVPGPAGSLAGALEAAGHGQLAGNSPVTPQWMCLGRLGVGNIVGERAVGKVNNAQHVILHIANPRFFRYMTSYDYA